MRLTQALRQGADRWLFRHHGVESGEVFLGQRRIFIIPSRTGMAYGVMLLVLFIGSVNYNLSMGFTLTFLLAACALIDMHLTFRNLAHLHLVPGRGGAVFAGDDASFELYVTNRRKHARFAIAIGFMAPRHKGAVAPLAQLVDVDAGTQCAVVLNSPATRRGWMQAPRVRLSTSFPLGLLTAWSYWHPDVRVLVYPRPSDNPRPLPQAADLAAQNDGSGQAGDEDFAGIRPYQPGDSLKRLAWRQIARLAGAGSGTGAGTLVSKHFEGGAASELRLDFAALPAAMPLEERLSCMARWVIEAEALAMPYAFALEHIRHAPALGAAHQEACLRALALYGDQP